MSMSTRTGRGMPVSPWGCGVSRWGLGVMHNAETKVEEERSEGARCVRWAGLAGLAGLGWTGWDGWTEPVVDQDCSRLLGPAMSEGAQGAGRVKRTARRARQDTKVALDAQRSTTREPTRGSRGAGSKGQRGGGGGLHPQQGGRLRELVLRVRRTRPSLISPNSPPTKLIIPLVVVKHYHPPSPTQRCNPPPLPTRHLSHSSIRTLPFFLRPTEGAKAPLSPVSAHNPSPLAAGYDCPTDCLTDLQQSSHARCSPNRTR